MVATSTSVDHGSDQRRERVAMAQARVGRVLGERFHIERLIGLGGTAAVYEARHRNGNRVALKVLHRGLDASPQQRRRFLREPYVANTIGHAGVARIYDDGVDASGDVFLVMELLAGSTLAELHEQCESLPLEVVLDVADQLLDVLAAAHHSGIVHRDIKPANLFITTSGALKVLDFGSARVFEGEGSALHDTRTGATLGTPAFMPQEQARGRWDEIEARSDLWAVGATLFTLVSGRHVHEAGTPNEQLGRAMTLPARSLASVAPDMPEWFVAVVDRALQFERAARWLDAREMQAALAAGRAGAGIAARMPATWWSARAPQPLTRGMTTASASQSLAARAVFSTRALPAPRLAILLVALLVALALPLASRARAPSRPALVRQVEERPMQALVVRPEPVEPAVAPIMTEVAPPAPARPVLRTRAPRPSSRAREPQPAPERARPLELDPLDLRY